MKSSKGAANRLIKEKSPYLLQHAYNPVDWYPWGQEAFEKAAKENKLVFLSIGYSTCHWCHVMERESFESPEVAGLLNQDFVSIKVDREERPDIDHIYMTAIQAMTGSGGWPLTVFLTPEAKPVTGGTYFPPEDRWGRPGMKTILPKLANHWKSEPEKMREASAQITDYLQPASKTSEKSLQPAGIFEAAFRQFQNSFDSEHGGFGGAPKFPRTHDLSFLLRVWQRHKNPAALEMVEKTLQKMAEGGIYDHLGGGFCRYATDESWLVPHFEKMLYDQASLARTYLEAHHATRNPFYAEVARDIFRYLLRDMTSPEGGFYSAEDADSEGEEGKFYVWRPEEIKKILGEEDAARFSEFYGVTDRGNFEHGTSILHIADSKAFPEVFTGDALKAMREKLFVEREKRIHPYKDDKILTAWNGMMISALAYGALVLDEPLYAQKASRAAEFILKELQKNGRLLRRFREGQSEIPGFQDDYAFFALSLLDLYEATFEIRWFQEAKRLTDDMIKLFWDEAHGGFFYTGIDAETLIVRTKEYYDGASPSGNSTAALLLIRLARMTGIADYEKRVEKIIASNQAAVEQHPVAFPQLLMAVDFAAGPSREIVIAGNLNSAPFALMLHAIISRFDPNRVILHHPEGAEAGKIQKLADFIKNQKPIQGKTAVYVCRDHQCDLPVTEIEALQRKMESQ